MARLERYAQDLLRKAENLQIPTRIDDAYGSYRNRPVEFVRYQTLLEQRRRITELEHAQARIIPWVFHRQGERIKGFRRAWTTATKKAGIPGALFHDFRRTCVRALERAGVPRSVAMQLTGHRTESVYCRYDIVDEADLGAGVERLALFHREPCANGTITAQSAQGGGSEATTTRRPKRHGHQKIQ